MLNYGQMKATNEGTWKKIRVFFEGSTPGQSTQPKEIVRTLAGTTEKTIGPSYRRWQVVAKIDYSPASDYATLADIERWFTGNAPANHVLQWIDHMNVTHNVVSVSDVVPQPVSPVYDGAGSYYVVLLEFVSR